MVIAGYHFIEPDHTADKQRMRTNRKRLYDATEAGHEYSPYGDYCQRCRVSGLEMMEACPKVIRCDPLRREQDRALQTVMATLPRRV